ncbi:right-handed parallel beta-helix repeat-containing protein [Sphingomonas prati]|uniref:right-handed parallel beta-helix repeat-containing protein n=1 Tax=Sphingomonas prati TaxID=1843237 RepID=UPI0016103FA6|nr:right-handed parallel beta-helix repeat-containing protein [Sphingomonas prati]
MCPALPSPAAPVTPPVNAVSKPGVNGALIVLKGAQSGMTIGPARVTAGYRAVEAESGSSLRDSSITGLTAVVERDGIRLRDAQRVTIENFDLRMRAELQTGGNLPEGIAITSGSGIVIRNGTLSGFRMVEVPGKYTNGDGIATEGKSSGTITNVTSSINTDGGYDLKGTWTLDNVTAEANSRNFRFWDSITARTITSANPVQAHIWVNATGPQTIVIDKLIATSTTDAPILRVENDHPVSITIKSCVLDVPAGTEFLFNAGGNRSKFSFGPGCKLP